MIENLLFIGQGYKYGNQNVSDQTMDVVYKWFDRGCSDSKLNKSKARS